MKKTFFGQFSEDFPSHALHNTQPSATIPDQAMSIPEIIAKFTRTGLLPESYLHQDEGGNEAFLDSEFDPLDHNPSEFDPAVHEKKLKALQKDLGTSEAKNDSEVLNEDPKLFSDSQNLSENNS